ncbi:hypothetical protein [Ensifer canadensis]
MKNLKLLYATTDRLERGKELLSTAFQGVEAALEAVGGGSEMLKTLDGHPPTHILGENFFTAPAAIRGPQHKARLARMKTLDARKSTKFPCIRARLGLQIPAKTACNGTVADESRFGA